jgi:hypothetical protein
MVVIIPLKCLIENVISKTSRPYFFQRTGLLLEKTA